MMTNAERAARGERAFNAVPHDDNDPITNVYDLVGDLLHYADTVEGQLSTAAERNGHYVARMALYHYDAEIKEGVQS